MQTGGFGHFAFCLPAEKQMFQADPLEQLGGPNGGLGGASSPLGMFSGGPGGVLGVPGGLRIHQTRLHFFHFDNEMHPLRNLETGAKLHPAMMAELASPLGSCHRLAEIRLCHLLRGQCSQAA